MPIRVANYPKSAASISVMYHSTRFGLQITKVTFDIHSIQFCYGTNEQYPSLSRCVVCEQQKIYFMIYKEETKKSIHQIDNKLHILELNKKAIFNCVIIFLSLVSCIKGLDYPISDFYLSCKLERCFCGSHI